MATVLITGGSSGIGFALAARYLTHGNDVIITGRSPARLARAAAALSERSAGHPAAAGSQPTGRPPVAETLSTGRAPIAEPLPTDPPRITEALPTGRSPIAGSPPTGRPPIAETLSTGRSPIAGTSSTVAGTLTTIAGDLSDPADRARLAAAVPASLDVLINNAGIQRRVTIADDDSPWSDAQTEIDTLLAAPIHLSRLLIPSMLRHGRPSVLINVTSGGAFIPQPFAPLYSAAKAALHSWTVNLRHALAATPIRVVELIPPAVATALADPPHGADPDDFADTVFPQLTGDHPEVGFGPTATPAFTARLAAERVEFEARAAR